MRFLARIAFVAALLAPAFALAQTAPIAGDWYGALNTGATVPIVVHIKPDGTATIVSPTQSAQGMPGAVTLIDGKARIVLTTPPVVVEGALSADGQTLSTTWRQGGASLPLLLSRNAPVAVAAPNRPQTPKPPFPYRAEDVSFANPATDLKLSGTLTLPQGKGPFPAVLLITGSGAQDRDETIFDHKPFLLIADRLTRRGVAVLRLDDRGVGGSQAPAPGATMDDAARDVAASLTWLRARDDIAAGHVGVLGHSEGGSLAIRTAAHDPTLAFVVLMAAPGVSGERLINEQLGLMLKASGAPEAEIAKATALQSQLMAAVATSLSDAEALAALNAVYDKTGMPADAPARRQLPRLLNPHYRSFVRFDPAADLSLIKAPVLAIGGAKDLQVPAATNLTAIKAALPRGIETTVRELPNLNHLFQTAQTGLIDEYGQIEETLAPAALNLIVDWTVAHAVKP
jgi:pimeloyl-ACP methyl ester carboxylesterase